jgi:hypothetical protein
MAKQRRISRAVKSRSDKECDQQDASNASCRDQVLSYFGRFALGSGNAMELLAFELRDIDGDVVDAWQKYFRGIVNVRISQGEIFETSADAIISPANSFG